MTKETLSIGLSCGLSLEAFRYPGGGKTPALCIPGLTRNARDFEDITGAITETGRDVVAVSLRGRGGSDIDPDYLNYHPATYRDDIIEALDHLGIASAVFIGTSLGGITAMLVAAAAPDRVAAAVINDVGPELAPEGIARIVGYAGSARGDAATLEEAAGQIRAVNEVAFPNRGAEFWLAFAQRTYKKLPDGRWTLDYDQRIGKALVEAPPASDLWSAFAALKDKPTLIVRGALSDLLSPAIVGKMRAAHPSFDYCEIAGVGHAPMLTEPEAAAAVAAFLKRID
ncbi:MAG: alpha/beta hydrolase [Pseudomonadota bacterium]|nr:alpha/beta hydrolase [Pseudomonadota bacterium]